MECAESRGADGEAETILTGRLADQAAFIGVINTLYNLHLPIISVTCLGDDQENREGREPGPMHES